MNIPSLGEVYNFLHISWTPPRALILLTPSRPRCSISSRSCLSETPYWAGRPSTVAISSLLFPVGFCQLYFDTLSQGPRLFSLHTLEPLKVRGPPAITIKQNKYNSLFIIIFFFCVLQK